MPNYKTWPPPQAHNCGDPLAPKPVHTPVRCLPPEVHDASRPPAKPLPAKR